jgi:hypothetical protein
MNVDKTLESQWWFIKKGMKPVKDKKKNRLEHWISGTGQNLWVHPKASCRGPFCVIHNPSDHHMKDWPTNWRQDKQSMERICPHGIGHPDPDEVAFLMKIGGPLVRLDLVIHGCDGCCKGSSTAAEDE